jgi:hypothetical protein
VWFSAGEKHWHGASPTTAMTHIAIQEASTARSSNGWSMSQMNSTAPEPARRHPNGRTGDAEVFLYAFDLIELAIARQP